MGERAARSPHGPDESCDETDNQEGQELVGPLVKAPTPAAMLSLRRKNV